MCFFKKKQVGSVLKTIGDKGAVDLPCFVWSIWPGYCPGYPAVSSTLAVGFETNIFYRILIGVCDN